MKKIIGIVLVVMAFLFASCGPGEGKQDYSIAVFVPGVTAGSPTYEMMVAGVEKAAAEFEHVTVKVVEGGFNQAEWQGQVIGLAVNKQFDLIVTSNPSMPVICEAVSKEFPEQKFLILDGFLENNKGIFTFQYNQREQAFLSGYFAALVSKSDMAGANEELKVGMIVGQEYPVMNEIIRPGFEFGLKAVDPEITLDFRVIGNWYDAAKASELSKDMFAKGVDVILTIAGGANQGVVTAASEAGKYVLWFDSSGYEVAEGVVVGSTLIRQDVASYEKTKLAIEGKLPFGTAETAGVETGFVDFIDDNPLYKKHVSSMVQDAQSEIMERMRSGNLKLDIE